MKVKLLSLFIFSLVGCFGESHPHRYSDLEKVSNIVHYYKDDRTNICFAGSEYIKSNYTAFLTTVQCTPEVEKLVGAWPFPD